MTKKIGALWKNTKVGDNQPVATGQIEVIAGYPIKVALFKNDKKGNTKAPDYQLVLSSFEKSADKINASAGKAANDL